MKKYQLFLTIFFIFEFSELIQCQNESDDIKFAFKPCDENDLDECFKQIMQSELIANINGSEALNIPPLEPLEITKQRFNYSGQNGIEVAMIIESAKIYGITKSKIMNVKTSINEKGLRAVVEIYIPRIETLGTYKANVKINDLKIRPKGEFNVTISDTTNTHKIVTEFETIDNKKFLSLKSITMDPKVGDIKFNATGIFPDPVLNDLTVQLINRNLPVFYKLIVSETQSIWEPLIITATNDLLKKIPYDRFVAEGKSNSRRKRYTNY